MTVNECATYTRHQPYHWLYVSLTTANNYDSRFEQNLNIIQKGGQEFNPEIWCKPTIWAEDHLRFFLCVILEHSDRITPGNSLRTGLHWDPRVHPPHPPPLKVSQSLFGRALCPSSPSDNDEITVRVKQNWTCCVPALHGLCRSAQEQDQQRGPAALEHQEETGAPGGSVLLRRCGTYFGTFYARMLRTGTNWI